MVSARDADGTGDEASWQISSEVREQLLAALSAPPASVRMSYEQFLAWADEDTLAEWVDGAVRMASPASLRHQQIVSFVAHLLSMYASAHAAGRVISAPFQMKLERSGREPDVLYVAQTHLDRLKETYLDGPADLVVEVISPESAGRDRGDKFYEYRQAHIPEYWLIDPRTEEAELYQLDGEGRYELLTVDADGWYTSRVLPGFRLKLSWLWQDPPPDSISALLQMDRDAYAAYLRAQLRQAGL